MNSQIGFTLRSTQLLPSTHPRMSPYVPPVSPTTDTADNGSTDPVQRMISEGRGEVAHDDLSFHIHPQGVAPCGLIHVPGEFTGDGAQTMWAWQFWSAGESS